MMLLKFTADVKVKNSVGTEGEKKELLNSLLCIDEKEINNKLSKSSKMESEHSDIYEIAGFFLPS